MTTETVCPGVIVRGKAGACSNENEELLAPPNDTAVTTTFLELVAEFVNVNV